MTKSGATGRLERRPITVGLGLPTGAAGPAASGRIYWQNASAKRVGLNCADIKKNRAAQADAFSHGKDITGWKALNPAVPLKWTVQDGVLRNAPPTSDILSEQKFWNFELHVDFRIVEHSNSGIGLRGRYEVQILEDYGQPVNVHGAGALYSRIAPAVNASKPAGEWQSYDIRLVGRDLTVVFNGKKVLDKVEVEGLTAIATNSDEADPGPFIVQGDHSYVEIKSFVVTPLIH